MSFMHLHFWGYFWWHKTLCWQLFLSFSALEMSFLHILTFISFPDKDLDSGILYIRSFFFPPRCFEDFLFIFSLQQFDYDMPRYYFLCTYPNWFFFLIFWIYKIMFSTKFRKYLAIIFCSISSLLFLGFQGHIF